MTNSRSPRKNRRRITAGMRVLVVALAITSIGPPAPYVLLAQQALDCSVNGLCLSPNLTNLLGLPNGTLTIAALRPWDRVVKGSAASDWAPIEVEARAVLAAIHGVPNDDRLPHAALDELRAQMFMRLLSIARKKSMGQEPLTGVEDDALETFRRLLVDRRVRAAQKALDEYARWQSDPCHYTVPAGFGFDQYEPGPLCDVGGVMLSGPPRPPTKEQFTAYGMAVATKAEEDAIRTAKRITLGIDESDTSFTYDTSADAEAAYRDADEALAIAAGVAGGVLASGVAAIAASASVAVGATFAAMSGSFAVFGTVPSTASVGAFASAGAVGVGVAASLPALIIASVVVAVVYIIQFNEDQSVLPMLQQSLEESRQLPDIWAVAGTDLGRVELFATFIYQTLPSYDAERIANVTPPPPGARRPGDPQFEIDGVRHDLLETLNPAGRVQQAFMSQGWFVTRTQEPSGAFGPWRWSLTLRYRGGNLSDAGTHTAGIQPQGFLHVYQTQALAVEPASKTTELHVMTPAFASKTVKWHGNRAPRINPSVSEKPEIALPVHFLAGASDPDGHSITAIRWFFEDPTATPLRPSIAECSLTPPGQIDPLTGFPFTCPWAVVDDAGTGVSHTFAQPGTLNVLVMAMDSEGAVGSERFTVTVGNLAPALTITHLPFVVLPPAVPSTPEGQSVTVGGTVHFPALPNGSYAALTMLVVDWGDGEVTTRMYPCSASNHAPVPSDATCAFVAAAEPTYVPIPGQTLTPGPWSFSFSHVYAYGGGAFTNPAQIRVYAVTTLNGRSQTERLSTNIENVPPVFEPAYVCPLIQSNPLGVLCVGGDIREVAIEQPLSLRGRIFDVPAATHFVQAIWGDGTSSALPAGCAAPGCPGTVQPWLGATPGSGFAPKYFNLSHTYAAVGVYPITLVVDDSGPNGSMTYSTQATVFGLSPLDGPTEVAAGASASYSYEAVFPAGAAPVVTPTCEGGDVLAQTMSGFTCVFDDVPAATPTTVKLQTVVAGTTFDRVLDVTVLERPTAISAITGPDVVTAGTTATYAYSATHSPFGGALFLPTCGPHGVAIASVGGASLTCRFNDLDAVVTTDVGITVIAGGGTATSTLAVAVLPDVAPPVLTLPATVQVNSASNSGAVVNFAVSAVDAVSGPAGVLCTAASGQLFPVGTTNVSCEATDWTGNKSTGGFAVVVRDVSPPSLTLPAPQILDAVAPDGVAMAFDAAAADAVPLAPNVSCQPAPGATFPIGTTTVRCSATDAAGNTTSGSFTVTVRGALEQLAILQQYVDGLPLHTSIKKPLSTKLRNAVSMLERNKTSEACEQLADAVGVVVQFQGRLTGEQSARILSDLDRIRVVIGC